MTYNNIIDFSRIRTTGKSLSLGNPCSEIFIDDLFHTYPVLRWMLPEKISLSKRVEILLMKSKNDISNQHKYPELKTEVSQLLHACKEIIPVNSVVHSSFMICNDDDHTNNPQILGQIRYLKSAVVHQSDHEICACITSKFSFLHKRNISAVRDCSDYPHSSSIFFEFDIDMKQAPDVIKHIHAESIILDTHFPIAAEMYINQRIDYVYNALTENSKNKKIVDICNRYLKATPFERELLDKSILLMINQEQNRYRIEKLNLIKTKPKSIRQYQKI